MNNPSVLRQLVCSGVMAALEVRRAGFPNRMRYRDFVKEFKVFTPPGAKFRNMNDDEVSWTTSGAERAHVKEISLKLVISYSFYFLN